MRARQESDEGDREGGRAAKAAEGRRALTLGSDGSVIQVGARTSMSSFSFVSLLSLSLSASQRLSGYVAFPPLSVRGLPIAACLGFRPTATENCGSGGSSTPFRPSSKIINLEILRGP